MTKKTCTKCGRRGQGVVARDSNSSSSKRAGGRCECRHGCGKTKADARKAQA
jgi:hypothetical protein